LATLSTYAYPVIGTTRVGEVTTEHMLEILQPHWQRVPETMSRLRGRVETVLGFAKAKGWRQGENVAVWRGHLQALLPAKHMVKAKTKHHEQVPLSDLPTVFARLRTRKTVGAQAAAFAILAAARPGEAAGTLWPEIDFETATWTVPAERYKTGHVHMVPLSAAALEILRERLAVRRKGEERIFPTRGASGPSDSTMRTELRLATGKKGSTVTTHGTARAGLDGFVNTRTSYPTKLVDWALGHAPGGLTTQAYRRECLLEQRRPMMGQWAEFLLQEVKHTAFVAA
jgi:integrase